MTRRVISKLLLLTGLVTSMAVPVGHAHAEFTREQRQLVLEEAQATYAEGIALRRTSPDEARRAFQLAAERFELLLGEGPANGPLHYNLANATMQTGRLGPAILEYRRAEAFIPSHRGLRHNLDYARSQCADLIEPSGARALGQALLFWHHRTTVAARVSFFLVVYLVLWIALIWRCLRRHPALTWIAITAGAACLALGASIGVDLGASVAPDAGVILADEIVLRKGNGEGFEPVFAEPLHEGVEFRVDEARGTWTRVTLANGKSGWLPNDAIGLFRTSSIRRDRTTGS